MQIRQSKPLALKTKNPRQIWLSFILTLFIFTTTVSGYFLVQHSQDIRRSANEPYENCTSEGGLWKSDTPCCSGLVKLNTPYGPTCAKPGECTPGSTKCQSEGTSSFQYLCNSSGHYQKTKNCEFGCSGNVCKTGGCTPGSKRCAGDGSFIETCSSDGSAWNKSSCPSNTTCNSQSLTCVSTSTPTPVPTSTTACISEGGLWKSGAFCCSGLVKVNTLYGPTCAKPGECTPGSTKCQSEGASYFQYLCNSSGHYQKTKNCEFGCSGNVCKTGGCTPGSKRCTSDKKFIETCSSDGSAWNKSSCPSNTTCNSQSLTCINTSPTCEGTCYTNSSCSAIGKVAASGSCVQPGSICCKEATVASGGLKAQGEACSSGSECASGTCAKTYINNVGQPVFLGSNLCVPSIAVQDQSVVAQNKNALIYGTAGALGATTIVAGGYAAATLPALTPLGAYSYAQATLATAPGWVQTGLTATGLVSGLGGMAGGTYACAKDPYSDACVAYHSGIMADPTGLMQLASATDDFFSSSLNAISTTIKPTGTISISEIHPHEPGYNVQSVNLLTNSIQEGNALPPISITEYNKTIVSYDGANRITAALNSGLADVDYIFTPYKDLLPDQQALIKHALGLEKILPIQIPSSYIDFPAFYNYFPSWAK